MENETKNRYVILEDGTIFQGVAFGSPKEKMVEVVFNTSMVGYQEILSDPSYTDQAVIMTYPLIGNYGMNAEDYESKTPSISGLIVREYNDIPSNFRSTATLCDVMVQYEIAGISQIDTRRMARHIRDFGSCKAIISATGETEENLPFLLAKMKNTKLPTDAVSRVSTKKSYVVLPEHKSARFHVVAIDCGMKQNIVRDLCKKDCKITVVPWNTDAKEVLSYKPDGVFLSNGPGDPTDVSQTIQTVRDLIGKVPIFGICLGHQILALAYGATTYKLKFGHRGGNHPVKYLARGSVEITSQNHSYAVNDASVAKTRLQVTHINLLDNTIEGICCKEDLAFSVQYHPESAPGPQDSGYLFDIFAENMQIHKKGGNGSCQRERI